MLVPPNADYWQEIHSPVGWKVFLHIDLLIPISSIRKRLDRQTRSVFYPARCTYFCNLFNYKSCMDIITGVRSMTARAWQIIMSQNRRAEHVSASKCNKSGTESVLDINGVRIWTTILFSQLIHQSVAWSREMTLHSVLVDEIRYPPSLGHMMLYELNEKCRSTDNKWASIELFNFELVQLRSVQYWQKKVLSKRKTDR